MLSATLRIIDGERVVAELKTTFASHYTKEISLAEATDRINAHLGKGKQSHKL